MLEIRFGFFAEDLRNERSGQMTAVGIWGSRCFVPEFPAILRSVAISTYLENPEGIAYPFLITMMVPGMGTQQHRGTLNVQHDRPGHFLGLMSGPVVVQAPSTITATVRIECDPVLERTFSLEVLQQTQSSGTPPSLP